MTIKNNAINQNSVGLSLQKDFFNSLQPFHEQKARGFIHGFNGFTIEVGVYNATKETNEVVLLFQKAVALAQEKGQSCCKVVRIDRYTHLSPEKINEIENTGYIESWLFIVVAPDGSLVPVSVDPYPNSLITCSHDAWKVIYPKFQQFLQSTYEIKCIEKKHTTFADDYYNTNHNRSSDQFIEHLKRPHSSIVIYSSLYEEPYRIADRSELCNNSHEYILSWKKSWEPNALPDYPFPECAISNNSSPSNMQFLFADCTKKQFTDIEIISGDNVTFNAHRLVLISAAEYFKVMLTRQMREGISNQIPLPDYDSKTVGVFLEYIYLEQDPFLGEGAKAIDAQQLLGLAHLCRIHSLTQICAKYIGQNFDENQWKELGQLGEHFSNKYLLQIYECCRNRKGKLLPEEMRIALKKHAEIDLPPSASAKALVNCDVAYGNSLGLLCEPHWDKEFPTRFIWKDGNWKGHIPVNKEFKFVSISSDNSIQWEKGPNHKLDQPSDKSVPFNDVQF